MFPVRQGSLPTEISIEASSQKYRDNIKEGNTTPQTTANFMLIQDDMCGEIQDDHGDDDTYDIYDFAFTQKTVTFQEMTKAQKIVLSQKLLGDLINLNWILLDSQSTINIFNNPRLFSSIRNFKEHKVVRCYCNGGYQDIHKIGIFSGIGEVYFNPKSLANLILLSKIEAPAIKSSLEVKEDNIIMALILSEKSVLICCNQLKIIKLISAIEPVVILWS